MPERKEKDKTESRAELAPDPEQVECEVTSLAAAVGWSLGAATRGFMEGMDRITGLLRTRPSRKTAGKKRPPQEPIEPLLEQLGQRVSEGAKEGYTSLSEDDAFWEVVERLHQQRGRKRKRPKAGPSLPAAEGETEAPPPSPDAPDPAEAAEAKEAIEATDGADFEDPLAGVLEEVEEASADGEGEMADKGKEKKSKEKKSKDSN